jgi:hypothetical protein
VTATDSGGNSITTTIQYYVGYKFSRFTSPIPNSKYNLGRTIPVKFQLLDYNNVIQTNGAAFCSVEYGNSAPTNTFPGVSCMPGSDSTSNTFKFDTKTKQYIYNLATSGYAVPITKGPLTIIVQLDGGVQLISGNGNHGFVLTDTVMLG